MKYTVKLLRVITTVVDAETVEAASELAFERAYREQDCRVLSVEVMVQNEAAPPKNPTPFDRPPEGTPGAGQMRIVETELIACAA